MFQFAVLFRSGNQELFGVKLQKIRNFVDSCIKDGGQALYHVEQVSVANSFQDNPAELSNAIATEKQNLGPYVYKIFFIIVFK
jgi:hypothetical protein